MLALRLKDMGYQVAIYTSAFDARRCFPEETVLVKIKVLPSETLNKIKAENNALLPVALNILRREKILAQAVAGMIEPRTDVLDPNDNWGARVAHFYKKINPAAVSVVMLNDVVTSCWSLFDDPLFGRKKNYFKYPLYWLKDAVEKYYFRSQDKILVLSEKTIPFVNKYLGQKANVIRSGVDSAKFKFVPRRAPKKDETIRLLSHGIYYIHRRYEDTIEAVHLLSGMGFKVKLKIIGDYEHKPTAKAYHNKLVKLVDERKLKEQVDFAGRVSDNELYRSYYEAHAFVSAAHMQTWGLAVFEAMSAGLPVAISKTIGAAEVLKDKDTAMFFEAGSPQSQAEALRSLFEDNVLYKRLSMNGNIFVREKMSWRRYADDILKFFVEALKTIK